VEPVQSTAAEFKRESYSVHVDEDHDCDKENSAVFLVAEDAQNAVSARLKKSSGNVPSSRLRPVLFDSEDSEEEPEKQAPSGGGGEEELDGISSGMMSLDLATSRSRAHASHVPADSAVKGSLIRADRNATAPAGTTTNVAVAHDNQQQALDEIPEKVRKLLYPHQAAGVQWLWSLHRLGRGGILADDMGLGKTMQISAYLAGALKSRRVVRALVVAPKTLLEHWAHELRTCGLGASTHKYFEGSQADRLAILDAVGFLVTEGAFFPSCH
jgi:SNF2 family DNA or RNA helicase